jgi:Fe-S cluster biogenesis protein NfuA
MPPEIEQLLNEIRPALAMHAGDVEFVSYEDGILSLKFLGGCDGCPLAQMTLKLGIEEHAKMRVPEIREVRAV